MNFRLSSILLIVCVFAINIHHETKAKAILDYFFDYPKFHNNYQHRHHAYQQPKPPKPVGGKERFKQICNVIHGINDCYA